MKEQRKQRLLLNKKFFVKNSWAIVFLLVLLAKIVNFNLHGGLNGIKGKSTFYGGITLNSSNNLQPNLEISCGYGCIKYILQKFSIQNDNLIGRTDEISFYDIQKILNRFEVKATPYHTNKSQFEKLFNTTAEYLLHFTENHFVVMLFANDKFVVVYDPSYGEVIMAKQIFLKFFDGNYIKIEK